jgi:hypothetical protein
MLKSDPASCLLPEVKLGGPTESPLPHNARTDLRSPSPCSDSKRLQVENRKLLKGPDEGIRRYLLSEPSDLLDSPPSVSYSRLQSSRYSPSDAA